MLCVLELCSDPEGRAADELVVLFEDNPPGDVSVDDVDGEVEGFWAETGVGVDLNKEVDKVAAHAPVELRLGVDEGEVAEGLHFHEVHVVADVLKVLGLVEGVGGERMEGVGVGEADGELLALHGLLGLGDAAGAGLVLEGLAAELVSQGLLASGHCW